MNNTPQHDIAIIGAGIVGLATAMRLKELYPRTRIVILEKEQQIATHQTGHNSGVIHRGIYYRPGSLKAKLCVEGSARMVQFAQENNIPMELCGKVIIATRSEQLPFLQGLWERGIANGVPSLELIDAGRVQELEPFARAVKGIYSPLTGIIDYKVVAEKMAESFLKMGGRIVRGAEVLRIQKRGGSYYFHTACGDFSARFLLNCAGLYSDVIATLSGTDPGVQIVPFRGEYYFIKPERRSLVRSLLYPVPLPQLPFLGVHFTRSIHGFVEAGPNAVLAFAREGYSKRSWKWREFIPMLGSIGFWKMTGKYWKVGVQEFYRSISKRAFVRSLQQLVPDISEPDLLGGTSGVRAQCVDTNGSLVDDFKIVEGPNAIHVLNVPSPAATASLAIADYVVRLSAKHFALQS